MPKPNYHVDLVKFDDIDIQGFYINKVYEATWNSDSKIWLQSKEGNDNSVILADNQFDSSKMGFDYDMNNDKTENFDTLGHSNHRRRRRSLWQSEGDNDNNENIYRVYNQYTGEIDEYSSSYRVSTDKEDPTLQNLPKNRTIFLDCTDEAGDECIEAQFIIHNFRPGSEAISINMNFSLDLTKFGEFPFSLALFSRIN